MDGLRGADLSGGSVVLSRSGGRSVNRLGAADGGRRSRAVLAGSGRGVDGLRAAHLGRSGGSVNGLAAANSGRRSGITVRGGGRAVDVGAADRRRGGGAVLRGSAGGALLGAARSRSRSRRGGDIDAG